MKAIESTIQTLEKDKRKQTDKHWIWHPMGEARCLHYYFYYYTTTYFAIINSVSHIDIRLRMRLRLQPPPQALLHHNFLTRTSTSASASASASNRRHKHYYTTTFWLAHRHPPPNSASDLHLRPPPPTSASELRPSPPTSASDLRLRLHCKDVNAPIYVIVGARIAFEGIAKLKF